MFLDGALAFDAMVKIGRRWSIERNVNSTLEDQFG